MEKIADLFGKRVAPQRKKGDPRTRRESRVKDFLERINPDRIATGRKPITEARFNKTIKDAGYGENLDRLWSFCCDAKNFSSAFWWKLQNNK